MKRLSIDTQIKSVHCRYRDQVIGIMSIQPMHLVDIGIMSIQPMHMVDIGINA